MSSSVTSRLEIPRQTIEDAYSPPANFLEIDVGDAQTHDIVKAKYTDYEVRLSTNLPVFKLKKSSVRRRYRDFEWLQQELERDSKIIVPNLPGKAWKRQLPFRGDEGLFEFEFIEERRKGLEDFINKVAGHPLAQNEKCLHMFLQDEQIDRGYIPDNKKMSEIKEKLLVPCIDFAEQEKIKKITIVGNGSVGMAAAYSIILKGVCGELVLIARNEDKLEGEMLDLQHCQQFMSKCTIKASSDYAVSANSDIVVVTAGARQLEGESRLNLVQRNVDMFKKMIPTIVQHSPNCILVIVSNPVDVLAYVAWKLSGFPRNRVLGTGTMLDSARFRFLLGEKLGVHPKSCHGYVIGEHGDSSVAVWSGVTVGGMKLMNLNCDIGTDKDTENYADIHKGVIDSAKRVIKLKGYTSWAIGATISSLCESLITNQHDILPLSVYANGIQGIEKDVFISLPVLTSCNGVTHVVPQTLNEEESNMLMKSVDILDDIIKGIQW